MGYVLQPNVHIEISSPQESALLRVSNNILRAVDRHEDVLLVLLDLSVPLTPMIMTFCYMDSTLVLDFVDRSLLVENLPAWPFSMRDS